MDRQDITAEQRHAAIGIIIRVGQIALPRLGTHAHDIPILDEVVMLCRAYLLPFDMGAVDELHIRLEPAALTWIIIRHESSSKPYVVGVQPQFMLQCIEHFLRTIQMVFNFGHIVSGSYLHGFDHRLHPAADSIGHILSTHTAVGQRIGNIFFSFVTSVS